MGILKGAADTVYAFRFIRMMVMDWKNWDAYKEGLIDENGKRNKDVKIDTSDKRSAYTPFVRLVANIKRLVAKLPGGGSKLGSFASALYLVKEKANLSEKGLTNICEKCNIEVLDFLNENNQWFLLENKQLSPGLYRIQNAKLLNKSCSELVWAKDQIRIKEDCYPIGDVFGVDIYEATHIKTNQDVYITAGELIR